MRLLEGGTWQAAPSDCAQLLAFGLLTASHSQRAYNHVFRPPYRRSLSDSKRGWSSAPPRRLILSRDLGPPSTRTTQSHNTRASGAHHRPGLRQVSSEAVAILPSRREGLTLLSRFHIFPTLGIKDHKDPHTRHRMNTKNTTLSSLR